MTHRAITIAAERQVIRDLLKRWYLAEDLQTVLWLAQKHGVPVRTIRRLQLGDPSNPNFGQLTEHPANNPLPQRSSTGEREPFGRGRGKQ